MSAHFCMVRLCTNDFMAAADMFVQHWSNSFWLLYSIEDGACDTHQQCFLGTDGKTLVGFYQSLNLRWPAATDRAYLVG